MTSVDHVNEHLPASGEVPTDVNATIKGSLQAIRRAALKARQVAQQTGTDLIVVRSGQVVRVPPRSKDAP